MLKPALHASLSIVFFQQDARYYARKPLSLSSKIFSLAALDKNHESITVLQLYCPMSCCNTLKQYKKSPTDFYISGAY